jgi:preprotein translocase SecF subunit
MNFSIIKNRHLWFTISGILVLTSLFLAPQLKLGIEFLSGTRLEVTLDKEITQTDANELVSDILAGQSFDVNISEQVLVITAENISAQERDLIMNQLDEQGNTVTRENGQRVFEVASIDPAVGQIFQQRALLAIIFTLIAIVIFVTIAFFKIPKTIAPWRFGLAAIVALAHDVIITIGVFSLLSIFVNVEVDFLFVTALLTVMGFSVHDTIVVFDRVREGMKGKSASSFSRLAEEALWRSMARSINTSFSTLIVLTALMVGLYSVNKDVFNFTLALSVGIVVGTYSSIFLAAPLLTLWQERPLIARISAQIIVAVLVGALIYYLSNLADSINTRALVQIIGFSLLGFLIVKDWLEKGWQKKLA